MTEQIKRPGMVWLVTILTLLGIFFSIVWFFASRSLASALLGMQEPVSFADLAGFVVIVPEIIFL